MLTENRHCKFDSGERPCPPNVFDTREKGGGGGSSSSSFLFPSQKTHRFLNKKVVPGSYFKTQKPPFLPPFA
jgi:hypothetical protein